jgi:hypothetical protein
MTLIPNLVFHHHTSLGDHFICNGIAHQYAKQCDVLHIPCQEHNYETVNSLYSDFDNIIVHPMKFQSPVSKQEVDEWAMSEGWDVTRIGFEKVYYRRFHRVNSPGIEYISVNFMRQFYEEAGILFKERYDSFHLPQNIPDTDEVYEKLVGDTERYIVVHKNSSASSDYPIELWSWRSGKFNKNIKIIEIQKGQTDNMLSYMKVIQNAEEIHCVDSAFCCLVDSVCKDIKSKLIYHDIRANNHIQLNAHFNGNRWLILDYDRKVI